MLLASRNDKKMKIQGSSIKSQLSIPCFFRSKYKRKPLLPSYHAQLALQSNKAKVGT